MGARPDAVHVSVKTVDGDRKLVVHTPCHRHRHVRSARDTGVIVPVVVLHGNSSERLAASFISLNAGGGLRHEQSGERESGS